MNKSEFVSAIAKKTGFEKNKTEAFLDALMETVMQTVAKGDKIQLVGFGTFLSRRREAYTGRNPKNGKEISVSASNIPYFKTGKLFKEVVNK
ncbi:MAG: HU family DNA-binding protein [Candidatus Improbicoccus pseudotrichonymphae]|uniref:HU family DNA-binding protein n=1 Tax=Candidatus Improbicoccus pseudotrichonymphae TaxID=3033792 RepID=A0AA48KZG2_9FIRM|nr:MAG: HU family DNA-binding protein [Candidatus Improbicoccus pseudotrichonymphae]